MRVGITWQHVLADGVLDEVERAAGGGVIGVSDPPGTVWSVEHMAFPDDARPDPLDQPRRFGRSAHARSIVTSGGKARLLCTVQRETTAASAALRASGRSAGTCTDNRMSLTRAGRSLAIAKSAVTASPSRLYPCLVRNRPA